MSNRGEGVFWFVVRGVTAIALYFLFLWLGVPSLFIACFATALIIEHEVRRHDP